MPAQDLPKASDGGVGVIFTIMLLGFGAAQDPSCVTAYMTECEEGNNSGPVLIMEAHH